MDDPSFTALSTRLRRRIDNAFDSAAGKASKPSNHRPRKKHKPDPGQSGGGGFAAAVDHDVSPGGFLVEDTAPGGFFVEDTAPGGFFVEDTEDLVEQHDSRRRTPPPPKPVSIPLSSIPTALRLLGLPPDDEEVLSVFRNAASGWETTTGADHAGGSRNHVSRKDWQAVCAALLEAEEEGSSSHDDGDDDDDDDGPRSGLHSETAAAAAFDGYGQEDNDDDDDDDDDGSGPDGDEYRMSVDGDTGSEPEEGSDVEYQDDKPASRRGWHAPPRKNPSGKSDESVQLDAGLLSAKQRAECREDYARFFPGVPDDELDRQKIMIKDVTRVASLLKENVKAEEIIEMLEAFSTSPDKSMNLQDFERMMTTTKLIR